MSRATVMNYIKYLTDARLVNMLYSVGEGFPKKPSHVYIYNTNLLHVINQKQIDELSESKIFFYNQMQKDSPVGEGTKYADFTIDNEYYFCIKANRDFKNNPKYYYVLNDLDTGEKNVIPIWLFGFLY